MLSSFNRSDPQFKVGEAVTRTIQLFALGASQEQLPDLIFENTDSVNIYTDKENTKSTQTADGTAVIREYVTSVIPTQAGEINLPAMEIKWWDTQTDTEKVATLAAETITVEGSAVTASTSNEKVPQVPGQTEAQSQLNPSTNNPPIMTPKDSAADEQPGIHIIISLILALTLTAAILFFMKHNHNHVAKRLTHSPQSNKRQSDNTSPASSKLLAEIESACHRNDIKMAYAITHKWFSQIADSNADSQAYPNTISPAIHNELMQMEGLLYSGISKQAWKGNALLMAINKYKANNHKKKLKSKMNTLQALYPSSDSGHQYV